MLNYNKKSFMSCKNILEIYTKLKKVDKNLAWNLFGGVIYSVNFSEKLKKELSQNRVEIIKHEYIFPASMLPDKKSLEKISTDEIEVLFKNKKYQNNGGV